MRHVIAVAFLRLAWIGVCWIVTLLGIHVMSRWLHDVSMGLEPIGRVWMQLVWMSRLSCVFLKRFGVIVIYLRICSFAMMFQVFEVASGLTCARQVCGNLDRGWSGPWLDLRLKSACWHDDESTLHDGLIAPAAMRVKMFVSDVDTLLES